MTLGGRIRQAREDRGLSQDEIASQFEISREAVSNWETGKARPDLDKIFELARILNTHAAWLVKGEDRPASHNLEVLRDVAHIVLQAFNNYEVPDLDIANVISTAYFAEIERRAKEEGSPQDADQVRSYVTNLIDYQERLGVIRRKSA